MTETTLKIKTLEEIIALNGKCLNPERCEQCPLRNKCHPTFYKSTDNGKSRFRDYERVNHALDILTNFVLLGDDDYEP